MIFKTKKDDFGRTHAGINNDIVSSVKGVFNGDFFKGQQLLSDSDIKAIKAYNAEIDRCVTSQTAFYRTMDKASKEAQNVVAAANGNKVALDGLTKSSKAAELGMKALSVAGNILVTVLITEAISALYKFSQVSKDVANSAQEIGSSFKETKKDINSYKETQTDINSYKEKVEELRGVINNSSSSVSEVTQARKDLMAVQDELIDLIKHIYHRGGYS